MEYIEIAKGLISNRGRIIPLSKLSEHIKEKTVLYRSYFTFDERIKEHLSSGRKSPSGFIGNFYLPYLVLDIDKKDNTEEFTWRRTKQFVEELLNDYELDEDDIKLFFSGTGYHIHIPDIFGFEPSNQLPNIVRETIQTVFPQVDSKPIHQRGLIRVAHTYNDKSGLYKVPILIEEVNSITLDEIKERAKTPSLDIQIGAFANSHRVFSHLIKKPKPKEATNTLPSIDSTNIVTCMQDMYKLGAIEGTRHERILRMVSWQKRAGTPLEAIIPMMKNYAPNMDSYEIEKIVTDTFNKGYAYGCDDKIMSQFCNPKCIFYKKKNYLPSIVNSKDLEGSFSKFIQSDWKKASLNLKDFFKLEEDFWVIPGNLVGLIGSTGLSKTALAQNIATNSKKFNPLLYISTEFSNLLLYRRFIQIEHGMNKDEVIEHYKYHNNTLGNNISHISALKEVPNAEELEILIRKFQPKLLFIDTVDDIMHAKFRGLESEDAVAKMLKQIAEKYDVIIVGIHHISKHAAFDESGNPRKLTVHSGKGSSTFEQKCDIVLGIEGYQNKLYRNIRTLKSRDNTPFEKQMVVDKDTFIFKEQ